MHNDDESEFAHPYAETTNRFAQDVLLREQGYEVTDRPTVGDALWRRRRGRSRKKFSQTELIEKLRETGMLIPWK